MAYNLSGKTPQQVRVGNWLEENQLQKETGIRFYANPAERNKSALTKYRCIEHSDQIKPKDYTTTTETSFVSPSTHQEMQWRNQTIGPRKKMLETKLMMESDAMFTTKKMKEYTESMKVDYLSQSHRVFHKDGFRPSLIENDPSVRVHTNHSSYLVETPITVYSDAFKNGKFCFPASFVSSMNPFARNSFFSDHASIHQRAESHDHPRQAPNIGDYQVLQQLRNRLISAVKSTISSDPGRAVRAVIGSLWNNYSEDEENRRSMSDIAKVFAEHYNFVFLPREKTALLNSFDPDNLNTLSLLEFTNLVRPMLSIRRVELVQKIFSTINGNTSRAVSVDMIVSVYIGNSLDNFLMDLDFIHASAIQLTTPSTAIRPKSQRASIDLYSLEDFLDYYCDISAEISDELEFENLLCQTWKL